MGKNRSYAQRTAIQKAQERKAAGDQHYNHAWRSLDTAQERLRAVQRSHTERPVTKNSYSKVFRKMLDISIIELDILKSDVKKAMDIQLKKEGR